MKTHEAGRVYLAEAKWQRCKGKTRKHIAHRKSCGMQRLPFKAKAVFFRPIYIVSRNGVLYVRHVNPYLVCASGFKLTLPL